MTVVDFIELSDDDINIIDLTNDDDTVQEDHIASQHQAMALLDRQGMFVLAGEGSQGVQTVFVAASEGSQDVQVVFATASEGRQEASESGHALEATASSMVVEKAPLVAASEGSQDVQAVFVAASEGSQDVQVVFVAASERRQEAAEFGHALEATALSMVTENAPLTVVDLALQHAESPNCPRNPTSATFSSPVSTTPKILTSEGGDAKLVRAKGKYHKKNYHTGTPRKSPRFEEKCESPVEELADDHKRSRMLRLASSMVAEKAPLVAASKGSQDVQAVFAATSEGRQEVAEFGHALEATALSLVTEKPPLDMAVLAFQHAESPNCPRTPTSATFTSPKILTSEGGDAKLVRVKRKHHKKNYDTGTPRRSPRFEQNRERPVEEPADDHKRCRTLEPAEESAASTDKAESATKPAN